MELLKILVGALAGGIAAAIVAFLMTGTAADAIRFGLVGFCVSLFMTWREIRKVRQGIDAADKG